jgi:hypothetical protein
VLDILFISDIIQAGKSVFEKCDLHCRNRLLTARMSGEIRGHNCSEKQKSTKKMKGIL